MRVSKWLEIDSSIGRLLYLKQLLSRIAVLVPLWAIYLFLMVTIGYKDWDQAILASQGFSTLLLSFLLPVTLRRLNDLQISHKWGYGFFILDIILPVAPDGSTIEPWLTVLHITAVLPFETMLLLKSGPFSSRR